jgi:Rab-like protein 2
LAQVSRQLIALHSFKYILVAIMSPYAETEGIANADRLATADLKIIMLGDSAVGKSKMVERFLLQDYDPRTLSTYALTMFRHNHTSSEGKDYSIDFWDTAGQEQFNKLHGSYYYQAHACILCFDLTRKITYKNLSVWYDELRRHCPDIPVICVANKLDADPAMSKKKFNFAAEKKLPFYFVSAADGTNCVRVFNEAIQLAIKSKEEPADEVMAEMMRLLHDDDMFGDVTNQSMSACSTRSATPC